MDVSYRSTKPIQLDYDNIVHKNCGYCHSALARYTMHTPMYASDSWISACLATMIARPKALMHTMKERPQLGDSSKVSEQS